MSDMRREEWERVDRLFAEVLRLPEDERARFLEASEEPDDVVGRVRRLLSAERSARERIGESAEALAADVMEAEAATPVDDLPPGSAVGPYRIIREIGRGGMGTVYLAERSDDTYDRRVALKVVKRGMDTAEVVTRFRREGRILARLEHPSIARMYDADVTADGRPYLVLEHVDGLPIDAFCDAERLTVEQRIRLFVDVCDAVSFAHGKLVLHRDLKPSNILVTADGPRLLDFGIAKALDEDDPEAIELTALVGHRLTPEYASPEQLAGGPISTASDVYALGVVLHELLTGARPDRGARAPSAVVTDATRTAVTAEAAGLRRSTPHRLARRLHGDLDVIVLKALHDDVARRYASVEAFAADLRRHLDGQPVAARPDSIGYRARKFVARNRLPVLSGSGLGVSVLLFAIGSFLQQAETARERDRADVERERAEQVAAVFEEMFTGAGFDSRERIDTLSVRQFLDQSARHILEDLSDQPVVQGSLLRILGGAQHDFGRLDEADSLLSRAVAVLSSAPGDDPRPLLEAQRDLGHLRMRQGRWADARTLYEAWHAVGVQASPEEEATVQNNIGLALLNQGKFDSAVASLDSSLAIHRARPGLDPLGYGSSLSMRAGVAQRLGDMPLALSLSREARDVMTAELGPDHPSAMTMEQNYAFMVYRSGRVEEAEPLYADLVVRYRAQVGTSADLPTLLLNHGNVLRDLGRPAEALGSIQEAVAMDRAGGGPALTFSLDALGTTLAALERYDEALEVFEEGLAHSERIFGEAHPNTAVGRLKVASARCRLAPPGADEPLADFRAAEKAILAAFPPQHPWIVEAQVRRGGCYLDLGRAREAEGVLEDAVAALEAGRGPPNRLEDARALLARARADGG